MPDNIGAGLEKTLSKLTSEMEAFEAISKSGFSEMADIKKAEKSFGRITTLLN
jgi:hypothetical protein